MKFNPILFGSQIFAFANYLWHSKYIWSLAGDQDTADQSALTFDVADKIL